MTRIATLGVRMTPCQQGARISMCLAGSDGGDRLFGISPVLLVTTLHTARRRMAAPF